MRQPKKVPEIAFAIDRVVNLRHTQDVQERERRDSNPRFTRAIRLRKGHRGADRGVGRLTKSAAELRVLAIGATILT
jgi:hypothetical protein